MLNLISVYAPQIGRTGEEKKKYEVLLGNKVTGIGENEMLIWCGDMNGRVGTEAASSVNFSCIFFCQLLLSTSQLLMSTSPASSYVNFFCQTPSNPYCMRGGKGFVGRNIEGDMLLEFADAMRSAAYLPGSLKGKGNVCIRWL